MNTESCAKQYLPRRTGWSSVVLLLTAASLGPVSYAAAQDAAGPVFPQPFLVEHQVVQTLPDGDLFATEPVTDYYGGSWIVSQRTDGSRFYDRLCTPRAD